MKNGFLFTHQGLWNEWSNGIDGFLSIRQLNERWQARWRHNISRLKTETSQGKHLVDLIQKLANKPNWNIALAIHFLNDKYSIPGPGYWASTTSFAKQLQNKTTGPELLKKKFSNTLSYCK